MASSNPARVTYGDLVSITLFFRCTEKLGWWYMFFTLGPPIINIFLLNLLFFTYYAYSYYYSLVWTSEPFGQRSFDSKYVSPNWKEQMHLHPHCDAVKSFNHLGTASDRILLSNIQYIFCELNHLFLTQDPFQHQLITHCWFISVH